MSSKTENVARNLSRIRKEQKLSLEDVSEMTGISRSMIGQIERGKTNPTLHVVEKLADGLQIDFFKLLDDPPADYIFWRHTEHSPRKEVQGYWSLTENFEADDNKKFHMFSVDILPGGRYNWDTPVRSNMIFLCVKQGQVSLQLKERSFEMEQDDELRFKHSEDFSLINSGSSICRCVVACND